VEQTEVVDAYLFDVTEYFSHLQRQLEENTKALHIQNEKIEHLESTILLQSKEMILSGFNEKLEHLENKITVHHQKVIDALKPNKQVVKDDSGVWVDMNTGLMWSRISIGQIWEDKKCYGAAKDMKWSKAKKACQKFDLAGFNDWRLPTKEELLALANSYKESLLEDILHNYWSSTLDTEESGESSLYYYVVDFFHANLSSEERYYQNYVRPVRNI
jgi:hypothetical protein